MESAMLSNSKDNVFGDSETDSGHYDTSSIIDKSFDIESEAVQDCETNDNGSTINATPVTIFFDKEAPESQFYMGGHTNDNFKSQYHQCNNRYTIGSRKSTFNYSNRVADELGKNNSDPLMYGITNCHKDYNHGINLIDQLQNLLTVRESKSKQNQKHPKKRILFKYLGFASRFMLAKLLMMLPLMLLQCVVQKFTNDKYQLTISELEHTNERLAYAQLSNEETIIALTNQVDDMYKSLDHFVDTVYVKSDDARRRLDDSVKTLKFRFQKSKLELYEFGLSVIAEWINLHNQLVANSRSADMSSSWQDSAKLNEYLTRIRSRVHSLSSKLYHRFVQKSSSLMRLADTLRLNLSTVQRSGSSKRGCGQSRDDGPPAAHWRQSRGASRNKRYGLLVGGGDGMLSRIAMTDERMRNLSDWFYASYMSAQLVREMQTIHRDFVAMNNVILVMNSTVTAKIEVAKRWLDRRRYGLGGVASAKMAVSNYQRNGNLSDEFDDLIENGQAGTGNLCSCGGKYGRRLVDCRDRTYRHGDSIPKRSFDACFSSDIPKCKFERQDKNAVIHQTAEAVDDFMESTMSEISNHRILDAVGDLATCTKQCVVDTKSKTGLNEVVHGSGEVIGGSEIYEMAKSIAAALVEGDFMTTVGSMGELVSEVIEDTTEEIKQGTNVCSFLTTTVCMTALFLIRW